MTSGPKPWGDSEKANWLSQQKVSRSYESDVVAKIDQLRSKFDVTSYGTLTYEKSFPLFILRTRETDPQKKTVLITGGVHGYETSGVHGALAFMATEAEKYAERFNIICAPCLSPWAYETINRWNPKTIDPNRNFRPGSEAQECALIMAALEEEKIFVHFDLHETTDTDNTVFRPALDARDAKTSEFSEIPDGFYLVGDTSRPQREFQRAVIEEVKKITHIAPPDANGKIIGVPVDSEGVIFYDMKKLSLCGGLTEAEYHTTTEVYPDSPRVNDQNCIDAQVAAVRGGLNFLMA